MVKNHFLVKGVEIEYDTQYLLYIITELQYIFTLYSVSTPFLLNFNTFPII